MTPAEYRNTIEGLRRYFIRHDDDVATLPTWLAARRIQGKLKQVAIHSLGEEGKRLVEACGDKINVTALEALYWAVSEVVFNQ